MIIGITGTLGAGKGTIVEYLVEKRGFTHFSVRAFLIEEIEKRELPVNRDSMILVANDLRAKYSPSYLAQQLFERAKAKGGNSVIESLRTPGEIETLRKKGNFVMLAVDADPKIRYERITKRKSTTDNVSFEKFMEQEKKEMTTDDPNKQNLSKCIEMADHVFQNNGTMEELKKEIEEFMNKIN